ARDARLASVRPTLKVALVCRERILIAPKLAVSITEADIGVSITCGGGAPKMRRRLCGRARIERDEAKARQRLRRAGPKLEGLFVILSGGRGSSALKGRVGPTNQRVVAKARRRQCGRLSSARSEERRVGKERRPWGS